MVNNIRGYMIKDPQTQYPEFPERSNVQVSQRTLMSKLSLTKQTPPVLVFGFRGVIGGVGNNTNSRQLN